VCVGMAHAMAGSARQLERQRQVGRRREAARGSVLHHLLQRQLPTAFAAGPVAAHHFAT
jgi:hypothetical protein